MPGTNRLGKLQRQLLIALRNGATLTRAQAGWLLDGRMVRTDTCAALYARGYLMWDERRSVFVLTEKGRRT